MESPINIQFEDCSDPEAADAAFNAQKRPRFQDSILKPEYASRKLQFAPGDNWIRLLPAVKPSRFPWLMPLAVQKHPGGQFIHPRSFASAETRNPFDLAYMWSLLNEPGSLFSADNREGVRLFTDPVLVCWALIERDGKTVARLLVGNGYDGSRGGVPGLGAQIQKAAKTVDAEGEVHAPDKEKGFMLCVEKTRAAEAKFPTYTVRAGRGTAPLAPILAKMSEEEKSALVPLEDTLVQLTEEEQWKRLEAYLPAQKVARIKTEQRR